MTAIYAAAAVLILVMIFAVHINAEGGAIKSVSIYGSKPLREADLPYIMPRFAEVYTSMYFFAALVLSVIATAQIIPEAINNRMFLLLISRPVSRRSIILAFFAGAAAAMTVVQLLFVISIFIILGVKTGVWFWYLLLSAFPLSAAFGSLYALMIYIGFLGKNTGIVTGLALGHVLFFSHLLASQNYNPAVIFGHTAGEILRTTACAVFPAIHELQVVTLGIIASGTVNPGAILFSLFPCVIYLWLSVRIFRKMDM